jgi:hypothetical protein
MKTTLIIILIYIVGYVLSYILGRTCYKHLNEGVWTVGDRITWLKRSFLSWFFVMASLIYVFANMIPDKERIKDNTPAKW